MKRSHEEFLHFATCMQRLNSAWTILKGVMESGEHLLVGPAFRFALVEYSAPYTRSDGPSKKRYRLSTNYVPPEFLELHDRILKARDSIHAHSDLTILDAKLYVTETRGTPSVIISSNAIHGLEEFRNITQIVSLIEGTLLNMYAAQDNLVCALEA